MVTMLRFLTDRIGSVRDTADDSIKVRIRRKMNSINLVLPNAFLLSGLSSTEVDKYCA